MTERCDCLHTCGDDHRVDRGLVAPCEYRKRVVADRAQLLADVTLLVAFASSTRNRVLSAALSRVLDKVRP